MAKAKTGPIKVICSCGKEFNKYSSLQKECGDCTYKKMLSKQKVRQQIISELKSFPKRNTPIPKKRQKYTFHTSEKGRAMSEADKWASRHNRLKYVTSSGMVKCYTCQKEIPILSIHDGHFIPRGNASVRYHENNRRPQCFDCNNNHKGKSAQFRLNLIHEIGESKVEELEAESRKKGETSIDFYNTIASNFKSRSLQLQKYLGVKYF